LGQRRGRGDSKLLQSQQEESTLVWERLKKHVKRETAVEQMGTSGETVLEGVAF